jgi:hypothetical protein
MAITPLWRAGAEMQHLGECTEYTVFGNSGVNVISSTKAQSGTYSFRTTTGYPVGKVITSTTQIRAGVFVNHAGNTNTNSRSGILGVLTDMATPFCRCQWNGNTSNLELIVNNSSVATVNETTAGFATTNTWYHVGMTYKANATTGFFTIYIDGVQRLTWSGNTGTAITGVYFGGGLGSIGAGWASAAYFDDFYIDDTVGEADAAPPTIELPWLPISGAGSNTGWSVYGAGSNYQAVDDSGAPNDLSDFAFGTSSGLNDSYAVTNTTGGVTVPSGRSIAAVIPCAWAHRTDAASASTLKLGSLLSGTTVLGSAQTLPVGAFGMIQERQATKPGGGSWTTSDADSMEYVQETAGSF